MTATRDVSRALVVAPLLLVAGAYSWLAVSVGSPFPWTVPIHEDGERTLAQTVLYWRHFLREIPVALLYVAAILIASGSAERRQHRWPTGWGAAAALTAAVLCGLAVWVVIDTAGPSLAALDLGQFFLRDDLGWPGAHWAAHYGACIVFWCGCVLTFAPWRERGLLGSTAASFSVALVVLALPLTLEPRSAIGGRVLAHQVREIMTHLAITLPLAASLLLGGRSLPTRWRLSLRSAPAVAAALVGSVVTVGLVVGTLASDTLSRFPAPWRARVATHLFEHSLDIALVLLLVGAWRSMLGNQSRAAELST